MNIATLDDYDRINQIFKPYMKTIFPHIRKDYILRKIKMGNVILEDDVVIIFGRYVKKQKIGTTFAKKGDAHIGQIASIKGHAKFVLNKFFDWINTDVWLTVRASNTRACEFYTKNGMIVAGSISWKENTIPGIVYVKKRFLK